MSLLAYAFGGGLAGVGEGLRQVGEHRQRMEGERLRQDYLNDRQDILMAFQKEQARLARQQQSGLAEAERQQRIDLAEEANRAREEQTRQRMEHSAALSTLQMQQRQEDTARRKEEGEATRGLRQQEITLRKEDLEARRAGARATAATKQEGEEEEHKRKRRAEAKEFAEKRLTTTDEETNEKVLDLERYRYWMGFWGKNDEQFPYQVPMSWNDIKATADSRGISLEEALELYRNFGHPVPEGDPPPHPSNPGGSLWPGRKRYPQ